MSAAGVDAARAASLVDHVLKEKAALKAAGQATNLEGELARSLQNSAEQERLGLLREKRNAALTILKRRQLEENTARLQEEGLSFERALTTQIWGDKSRVAGARDSAARTIDALRRKWRGDLARELDAVPGLGELLRKDADFDRAVRREMIEPGSTGDATARQTAAILGKSLEDIRLALNDAGANIGKLDNYAPQNHDGAKLRKAGQGEWVARMLRDLDWDRTMPGLEAGRRAEVLGDLWTTIITGQRPQVRETTNNPFRTPRNLATAFEHERTLHFKDAQTAAAYHAEFGSGTVLDALMSRMDRGSRRAGLMDVFGPNPESMLQSLHDNERVRLRNMTPDEMRALAAGKTAKKLEALETRIAEARAAEGQGAPGGATRPQGAGETALSPSSADAGVSSLITEWDNLVESLRAERVAAVGRFDVGERKGNIGKALGALLNEAGGSESLSGARIAHVMRQVRNVHSLSSLGSAALAAIGDIHTKAMWFRHGGENVFESLFHAFNMHFEGLQTPEKIELGRALGFYANTFLREFHARFTEGDAAPGWLANNVQNLFKLSGLDAWTEANRAACGFYLSNRLADNAGKEFGQLDRHYAATLKRAGLEGRWDLIRQLAATEADGHSYILPESARKLTDAQLEGHLPENLRESKRPSGPEAGEHFDAARQRAFDRLRKDLELDVLGYIQDEVGYAVIEPDFKTHATMTQGFKAGTAMGELVRAGMQFKSFPLGHVQRILAEQRWLRAADSGSVTEHAGGLFFAAVTCAAMGYLSITARDLSRGRAPRDPLKWETVNAAIMQGGGLGIFGDFFLGQTNRWGGGMAETAMGPVLGTAFSLGDAAIFAWHGEPTAGKDKAIRALTARLPYANLWWAKSALDYGMLFHLRERMSPGSLIRSEDALKKDFNQRYLKIGGLDFAPSKLIKRGGGFR